MMEQSFIVRACLFWPKFYYCLFKPNKNRRTIWEIITSPVPPDGRKASKQSNRIPCLNATFSCFSSYQVQGAYSHLNQRHEKYLDEAVAAATTLVYYNDPLRLAVPYVYLLEMLPEPPNGLLKSIFSLTLILIVYLYPILRGLTRLWRRSLIAYMSHRKLPTLHIRMYATAADPNEKTFSWDTDGIPFVVDNSATAIISNKVRLFHRHLTPTRVTLETSDRVSTKTQLV